MNNLDNTKYLENSIADLSWDVTSLEVLDPPANANSNTCTTITILGQKNLKYVKAINSFVYIFYLKPFYYAQSFILKN